MVKNSGNVKANEGQNFKRECARWYASYNRSSNDAVRARELMKRMLRNGGSEFYGKKQVKNNY